MRSDFIKVLTERPRVNSGSRFKDVRSSHRGRIDEEDAGFKEGMRRPHKYRKEFSDLLGPLHRFVQSNVGRKWDDVYSEICAHLKGRNTVQQHLIGHLFQYVDVKVRLGKDGKLYDDRDQLFEERRHYYYRFREFYVDPRDGILKVTKTKPYKREVEPVSEIKYPDGRMVRAVNGIWYEITVTEKTVFTWITRHVPGNDNLVPLKVPTIQKLTTKRQLNTKELKALHLRNAA